LEAGINRFHDVSDPVDFQKQLVISGSEDQAIKTLLNLEASYPNNERYFLPYNSNSFVAGLLLAAGIPIPLTLTGRLGAVPLINGLAPQIARALPSSDFGITQPPPPPSGSLSGTLSGTVSENGADGNGAFTATLSGPMSITIKASASGGFDYSGSVTLQQSNGQDVEDFTVQNGSFGGHVASLNGIATMFTISLNEGSLRCTGTFSGNVFSGGTFSGNVFSGTCTYSNPGENNSDSGSGFTFRLQ
jgi:hypothetical protein